MAASTSSIFTADTMMRWGRTRVASAFSTSAWACGLSDDGESEVEAEYPSAPTALPDNTAPRMKPAKPQIGPVLSSLSIGMTLACPVGGIQKCLYTWLLGSHKADSDALGCAPHDLAIAPNTRVARQCKNKV